MHHDRGWLYRYKLVQLATLGIAYNPGINGTLEIIGYLPKLTVLFARGCSLSGNVPVPNSATLAVMDVDENHLTSVDPAFCSSRGNLPALASGEGCNTDWPTQVVTFCSVLYSI